LITEREIMSDKIAMTFKQFQAEMITYAKKIQGDNYPGDDYYTGRAWKEYWDDEYTPSNAVIEDMNYWEPK
jgi:hypothetical protein